MTHVADTPQRKALGERIETLREDRGITKRHIYTSLGIHQVTYDRKLSGEYDFKFSELIRVADVLGVKVSELTSIVEESHDGKARL